MDETGLSARAERRGLSQRAVTYIYIYMSSLGLEITGFYSSKKAGPL